MLSRERVSKRGTDRDRRKTGCVHVSMAVYEVEYNNNTRTIHKTLNIIAYLTTGQKTYNMLTKQLHNYVAM